MALITRREAIAGACALFALSLIGCEDANRMPGEMDDDDAILNDNSAYQRSATYKAYGVRNGGRMAWRIPKIGRTGQKVIVRFSSGRKYPAILGKASRARSGYVFKNGSHGGYYIHAPYGDKSQHVTVYF